MAISGFSSQPVTFSKSAIQHDISHTCTYINWPISLTKRLGINASILHKQIESWLLFYKFSSDLREISYIIAEFGRRREPFLYEHAFQFRGGSRNLCKGPADKQYWANVGAILCTILGQYWAQYCPNIGCALYNDNICQYC